MCKISVIIVSLLMLLGCSQWGGSDPVGVTGGGDSGYGESTGKDISIDYAKLIIGSWENEEIVEDQTVRTVVTFAINKNVQKLIYVDTYQEDYMYGTYEIKGNVLTVVLQNETRVMRFSIRDNKLYLTDVDDDETTVFTRVE
jgi:hypothetical protein